MFDKEMEYKLLMEAPSFTDKPLMAEIYLRLRSFNEAYEVYCKEPRNLTKKVAVGRLNEIAECVDEFDISLKAMLSRDIREYVQQAQQELGKYKLTLI